MLEHQAAPRSSKDRLHRRAWAAGGGGGAGPLCSCATLRDLEGLWGGQEERGAGRRGGRRGSKGLLAELGCEELVESGGGQRSLLWRDRGVGIKALSRELGKKRR